MNKTTARHKARGAATGKPVNKDRKGRDVIIFRLLLLEPSNAAYSDCLSSVFMPSALMHRVRFFRSLYFYLRAYYTYYHIFGDMSTGFIDILRRVIPDVADPRENIGAKVPSQQSAVPGRQDYYGFHKHDHIGCHSRKPRLSRDRLCAPGILLKEGERCPMNWNDRTKY